VEREGRPFEFAVVARVFDIGAISFCFIHEDRDTGFGELRDIAFLFAGQEGLSDSFVQYLKTLGEIIRPHIRQFAIDPDFYEDYTVYVTDRRDDSFDPVPLMIGERTEVSPQVREEILKNAPAHTEKFFKVPKVISDR